MGICCLVFFLPVLCFGQIPTQGPSINLVTPDSVTIVWRTAEPASGSIELTDRYGKIISLTKENQSKPSLKHQVTIKNLLPEMQYGYTVISDCSSGWFRSEWISFSTAVKQNTSFRFASLSDCRGNENGVNVKVLSKIIEKVSATNPKLIVFEGDLINGVCEIPQALIQYDQWKKVLQPYWQSAPVYPGVGNHENSVKVDGRQYGEKVFAEEFCVPQNGPKSYKGVAYSFDYGNSHFISLDSNDRSDNFKYNNRFSPEQLEWLEKDLASTHQLHRFICLHDPAYPSGVHIDGSLDQHPQDRDKFLQICDQYNVDILFCGHEHNYDRKNLDSKLNPILHHTLYQVKNGTCGAPIYTKREAKKIDERNQFAYAEVYNFTIIDVAGPKVTVTAYDVDGKQIDQFSYQK